MIKLILIYYAPSQILRIIRFLTDSLCGMFNTLRPFITEELINKTQKNRSPENNDNIDDLIEFAPEYLRNWKT